MTFTELVAAELIHAREAHEHHPSLEHSLAVLCREVAELGDEIYSRHRCNSRIIAEAAQVAAMCQRMVEDAGLVGHE